MAETGGNGGHGRELERLRLQVAGLEHEVAGKIVRDYENRLTIERLQELHDSALEISEQRRLEIAVLKHTLRRLEWIDGRCPACGRLQNGRHMSSCWLAERLK